MIYNIYISREMIHMIKQMAWNTFKQTGDINTFLELMQFENTERSLNDRVEINCTKVNDNGEYKDKGNNIIGK